MHRSHRSHELTRLLGLLLVLGLLLAGLPSPALAQTGGQTGDDDPDKPVVETLEEARQAIVQIEAFGTFVDPQEGLRYNTAGRGSGFIIDESGLAVTNNHVVTGAAFVKVQLAGEEQPRSAKVVGVSECADLAVIDIDGEGFSYLEWYPERIKVGLEVYAAGFPLGDPEFTLTRGIVSKARANGDTAWASVPRVIEHDARINPGNSGGPLLDAEGRVVGVNYAGNSATGQFFAISKDLAQELVAELATGQDILAIGINGEAIFLDEETTGIWVASVDSGSPADQAGIEPGDVILSMEGLLLATDGTMADYCNILRSHDATDVLEVRVYRPSTQEILTGQINGRPLEASFAFDQLEENPEAASSLEEGEAQSGAVSYDEYVVIADDTETISVEIPKAWSDTSGGAWTDEKEQAIGVSIAAAQDLEAFYNTWTEPGLFIGLSESLAQEFTPAEYLDQEDFSSICEYDGRKEYSDDIHTGFYDLWLQCDGEDNLFLSLAMTPETGEYLVQIQMVLISDADLEALDHVLTSFSVVQPQAGEQAELPDPRDYVDLSDREMAYRLVETPAIVFLAPEEWTDLQEEPWIMNDQLIGQVVKVAPDIQALEESWDASGVSFYISPVLATEFTPEELLDILAYESCTYEDDPFEFENQLGDFRYTGLVNIGSQCGGENGSVLATLVAMPEGKEYVVIMEFQMREEVEAEALEVAGTSFFVPDVNVLLESETQEAEDGFTTLQDDFGYIRMEVPASWQETLFEPWTLDGEAVGLQLAATEDLESYDTDWSQPGMIFRVSKEFGAITDAGKVLDQLTFEKDCEYADRFLLEKEGYTGEYDVWVNCGEGNAVFALVVATPEDENDLLILLEMSIPDSDSFDVFQRILSSFQVDVSQDVDELTAALQAQQEAEAETESAGDVPELGGVEPVAIVQVKALNVRQGPGTNYPRQGVVKRGDQLKVVGQVNDCTWLQVDLPNGKTGWISGNSRYTRLTAQCQDIPEATPPPLPTPSPTTPPANSGSGSGASQGDVQGNSSQGCYLFQNQVGVEVTVTFTRQGDSWNRTFKLPKGVEQEECFDPGKYTYTLDAPPPWDSVNGELKVEAGDRYLFPIQPR